MDYTTYEKIAKDLDIDIGFLTHSIANYGETEHFYDLGDDGIYYLKKDIPDTKNMWKEIASCLSSSIMLNCSYNKRKE